MYRPTTHILWLLVFLAAIASNARALDELQAGKKAPDFALIDLSNRHVTLADVRESELVIVVFFATWSVNSREVLERLEKLAHAHAGGKLAILAIDVDSQAISSGEEQAIRELTERLEISFPVLLDRGLTTFRDYGVVAVPSMVAIDGTGMIVGALAGYPIALREKFFDLVDARLGDATRTAKEGQETHWPVLKALRYYNLGRVLIDRGAVDMAEVNLRKSIDADREYVLPLILLGQLYLREGTAQESVEFEGRTYQTEMISPQERERYLADAAQLFEKALALSPQNSTALTDMAKLHMLRNEYDEAGELLRQALKSDPAYTPALCASGAQQLHDGQLEPAQEALEKATELNPHDYDCYLIVAEAYEERGMLGRAVTLYRKGLTLLWLRSAGRLPSSFSE